MDKIERLTGRSLSKRKPGRRKADKLSVMSPEYAHFYSPIMPIWGSKMTILGLKTAFLGTLIQISQYDSVARPQIIPQIIIRPVGRPGEIRK